MPQQDHVDFRCNCCGSYQHTPSDKMTRENASCFGCGSSIRMRSIAHHVGMAMLQRPLVLTEFPVRTDITGIGMSDWEGYASGFERVFSYQNTFFHKEPLLDITKSLSDQHRSRYHFVVCTEVFEHILAPVQVAFDNLFALLRPGGFLVFTVPFSLAPSTREHFPDCVAGNVVNVDGSWAFVYKDTQGGMNLKTDLVFHGGPGSTLEMREFALSDIVRHLELAGFCNIQVQASDYAPFGIIGQGSSGHPLTAWKPTSSPA